MLGLRNSIENASNPEELAAAIAAAGPSPRWMASSLAEVGQFFGLATATIKGWRSDGMPGSDAGWPLDAIVRWRFDRLANNDLATEQRKATLEATQLANDARRLELSKERGELVELVDVERWASIALIEAREIVMSIPEKLATSAPPGLREMVRSEADLTCRAALKSLRRRLESDELDQDHPATGEADGDEPNQTEEPDQ